MSRRQSLLNVLNGSLDPVSAALWGFEGLPEALATVKMADTSLSDSTNQSNRPACEGQYIDDNANQTCDSDGGETESAQSSSATQEREMSLSDLWADPHGRDTLIGLDFQFSKIWEANTSKLTLQDYTQLYKANFMALNAIITSQDGMLVERIRAYQRREELENLQRKHMEEMRQIQRPFFDPEYSVMGDAQNPTTPQPPYHYQPAGVDPISQIQRDDGHNVPTNNLSYHTKRHSSPSSHLDPLRSSLALHTLEDARIDHPGRSGSWSAPLRDFPPLEVSTAPRSQMRSQVDTSYSSMGQS
ncbi:hypothetical protein FRC17_008823, partial [Serendipita sp. 399]